MVDCEAHGTAPTPQIIDRNIIALRHPDGSLACAGHNCDRTDDLTPEQLEVASKARAILNAHSASLVLRHGQSATNDYLAFIALKVARRDWLAAQLSPPPAVDKVWHEHLLDTRAYRAMNEAVCCEGDFIEHDPRGGLSAAARQQRRERAARDYALAFGPAAVGSAWREAGDPSYASAIARAAVAWWAGGDSAAAPARADPAGNTIRVIVVAGAHCRSVESERAIATLVRLPLTATLGELANAAPMHWRRRFCCCHPCVPCCCCCPSEEERVGRVPPPSRAALDDPLFAPRAAIFEMWCCEQCCGSHCCHDCPPPHVPLGWRRLQKRRDREVLLPAAVIGEDRLRWIDLTRESQRTLEECGLHDLATVHVSPGAERLSVSAGC